MASHRRWCQGLDSVAEVVGQLQCAQKHGAGEQTVFGTEGTQGPGGDTELRAFFIHAKVLFLR